MINKTAESEGSTTGHPMDFLLTEELNLPAVGDTRTGVVIEHRNNEILIDIGAKSEGIIPNDEIQMLDKSNIELLAVGNSVDVFIVNLEDRHGNVVVSYTKAAAARDWEMAEHVQESKEILETVVIGKNKGGLLAKVGLLRGFIPNSQLVIPSGHGKKNINDEIFIKIIEVDAKKNRLILSEKAAIQERKQSQRKELLQTLSVGDEFEGKVINIADFGAFVDLGDIEGLVHLSEISWKRISNPKEVLKVGDKVKVSVLKVDQEKERLALSIKQLQPDPWSTIVAEYKIGQLLEVEITKITKYGAFARINSEYGLEGLIHISEISEDHIEHPGEVLKVADKVAVRIIRIDLDQRQIGLSMKQVNSSKFVEADMEMLTSLQD
ncbi:MAG: S1 RNA-binding domain-containing protein [Chloroflexota bacterium]